jgi:hypothetical protein
VHECRVENWLLRVRHVNGNRKLISCRQGGF